MRSPIPRLLAVSAGIALLLAAGCGGGGGGTIQPPAAAAQLVGTAATGAALPNAPVSITNVAGSSPCVEASITTDALGRYTCTLAAGQSAPFFIVVTNPAGTSAPLVSIATATPAAGAALTFNATPLTTAIVSQLANGGDPVAFVQARSVDASQLQAVTSNVIAQLGPVLTAIGAPADYNPFTTSFTAATADNLGDTSDRVLDVVKVVTIPATGQLALSTIDNPAPKLLATATSSGATVSTNVATADLARATQLIASGFNACFAVPASQRVTASNTAIPANQGGAEVTGLASACDPLNALVADSTNAAGFDFLHNGYAAGQLFYGLLTSDSMTGARFPVPEIMAFYPADTSAAPGTPESRDRAVLNLRYLDGAGNPGTVITVAARLPATSSAARPTEWWLSGNRQQVDTGVRLNIRRVQQFNPGNTTKFSTFQSGLQFNINYKGFSTCQASSSLCQGRHAARSNSSALSAVARRRVRTARLQTVIDAADQLLRTLMKDARGGLNR